MTTSIAKMSPNFLEAVACEWLKRRHSHGAGLVIVGALFTPMVILLVRLTHHAGLPALYTDPAFWTSLWRSAWESMAIFFLPIAAMLTTSLVVQIEVRNKAWKQVHTLPLSPATIYLAKFSVIVLMLMQFLLVFVTGLLASAWLPAVVFRDVPYPAAQMPLPLFAIDTAGYFVDCLPMVAAQYLMGLRWDNFLAPIGIGFLAWVGALAALSWPHSSWLPYAYTMLDYLKDHPSSRLTTATDGLHAHALAWFVLTLGLGYALFRSRPHKG